MLELVCPISGSRRVLTDRAPYGIALFETWLDDKSDIGITHTTTIRSTGKHIALIMAPGDRSEDDTLTK